MTNPQIEDDWEKYFYPGTTTLINKFGITDEKELKEVETKLTFEKNVLLQLYPISKKGFDEDYLKAIHRYLFEDIYDWAGQYRTVSMQKRTVFTKPDQIESELKKELLEMSEEFETINIKDSMMFANFLATHYIELISIHPFREGNGRTIRQFLKDFVREKTNETYDLDWSKMDSNQMLESIPFARIYKGIYQIEFSKGLIKTEEKKVL